jgi:CRISPR system Cascade subunit CasD
MMGETHSESDYPTKFGIVRLLASALGYVPGDTRIQMELEEGLRFGVRVESPGKTASDEMPNPAHLEIPAQPIRRKGRSTRRRSAPKGPGVGVTILSTKQYIQDASFLVALELAPGAPSDLIARCAAALIRPASPVYLGRRSCPPTRPVFERLTSEYNGVEDALARYSWAMENEAARSYSQDLIAYIEDPKGQNRQLCEHDGCISPGGNTRCVKRMIVPIENLKEI